MNLNLWMRPSSQCTWVPIMSIFIFWKFSIQKFIPFKRLQPILSLSWESPKICFYQLSLENIPINAYGKYSLSELVSFVFLSIQGKTHSTIKNKTQNHIADLWGNKLDKNARQDLFNAWETYPTIMMLRLDLTSFRTDRGRPCKVLSLI